MREKSKIAARIFSAIVIICFLLVPDIVYVASAAPLKSVQQVPVDLNKPTIQLPRAAPSKSPTRAGFKPVNITTSPLSMTGMRFQPVSIATSQLSMTGMRFQPVSIATSQLSMTGMRFQPVSITTDPLSMTGTRAVAGTQ